MNRRDFFLKGLGAVGTALILGSGTRALKDRLAEALAQVEAQEEETERLKSDCLWWYDYAHCINHWWGERNKAQEKEIGTLREKNAILDSDWRFWYKIVGQERNHNRWLQEQLDLEMKMTDAMYERWAAAERGKAKLEEKYTALVLRSSPPLRTSGL